MNKAEDWLIDWWTRPMAAIEVLLFHHFSFCFPFRQRRVIARLQRIVLEFCIPRCNIEFHLCHQQIERRKKHTRLKIRGMMPYCGQLKISSVFCIDRRISLPVVSIDRENLGTLRKSSLIRGMDPNYMHPLFAPNYTHSYVIGWLIEWLMCVACNFFPFFLKNHSTFGV